MNVKWRVSWTDLFCISVLVLGQVVLDSFVEGIGPKDVSHHSDYGSTFVVGDLIKELWYLRQVIDGHRDWV